MNISLYKKSILGLILFVMLILAAGLRLYRLSYQSFWLDEAITVDWAKLPSLGGVIQMISSKDNHPPFYYIFLHFWLKLGESEFMARLPSVIAGVITVFLIFKITEILFGRIEALTCAFLAAVSPFYIWLSQEARMYSFLALFSLSSFYFFIKAIKENKARFWLGYIIFSLLALYTHYYALFTVFAEMLYFIANRKKYTPLIRRYFFCLFTVFLLFLPCFFILLQQFLFSIRRHLGLFPTTVFAIPHALLDLSLGYSFMLINMTSFSKEIIRNLLFLVVPAFVFAILFISGLIYIIRKQGNSRSVLFYFIIPLIVSFLICLKVPIFGSKYLAAVCGAYLIILAVGLRGLRQKSTIAIFTLAVLIMTGFSLFNYYFNDNFAKGGWRSAAEYISANSKEGDLIVFGSPAPAPAFDYYYKGKLLRCGAASYEAMGNRKLIEEKMPGIITGKTRVWFMPDLALVFDKQNIVQNWLKNNGNLVGEKRFKCVRIELYDLKKNEDSVSN